MKISTKDGVTTTRFLISRRGWPSGPWDLEQEDRVEWKDEATGLHCLLKRTESGHWCGYVGVPPTHSQYGKDYMSVYADVHGGITYGDHCMDGPEHITKRICHIPAPGEPEHLFWFGFDCNQSSDGSPTKAKDRMFGGRDGDYCTLEYVREQTLALAKQLTEL